ncbi:Protein CBR-NDX-9 [Aphelenchoides bicaudatus]|nr:Protein CBR-NDX-9 [Aphelenchoides bicaudatus]
MLLERHSIYCRLLARRWISNDYVNRVRFFEYLNNSDHALESEFNHAQALLMVDKEPLVKMENNQMELVKFETSDLKSRLNQYGLEIGMLNSCLLDIVEPNEDHREYRPLLGTAIRTMEPPPESMIDGKELRRKLADSLGGQFQNLRIAMLNIDGKDQNHLARFQSLTRWSLTFRRCPICTATLRLRLSKHSAKCIRCQKDFYPTNNPVAITLVRDESNQKCLLVRHLGSLPSIYTLIAGFSIPGESIQETVCREVAEEVGLVCSDIQNLNFTQSWPIPNTSLMLPFVATADMNQQINISPGEIESCGWFSREEVRQAIERTNKDPLLKGALKANKSESTFRYVPPHGAIAHQVISLWLNNKF